MTGSFFGAARLHITQERFVNGKDRPDLCMISAVATQRRESRDEAPAVARDLLVIVNRPPPKNSTQL
jgi:hypothetical protein